MRQALELLHICSWQVEFNTASVILLIGISLSWPESPVGEDSFSETECPGSGILCFLDFLFFFLALDPSLPNSFFDTLPLLCWRTKKTAELTAMNVLPCFDFAHGAFINLCYLLRGCLFKTWCILRTWNFFFFWESAECVKQSSDVHLKEKIVKITSIQQIFGECVIIL